LQAEGEKQAAIARAEGEKQERSGRAPAPRGRHRTAQAEAQAIRQISEAVASSQGTAAQYLLMQRYIESLSQMAAGNNSKVIFMPVETSVIGAFREIFATDSGHKGRGD
jgi:regulator of protease activity HflC (stomatin/prohibitin superfamily)